MKSGVPPVGGKNRWRNPSTIPIAINWRMRFGGYPEGCSYSILIMNLATPLIDRFTRPRMLGEVRRDA